MSKQRPAKQASGSKRGDRFERRAARNRYVIIAMAALMILSVLLPLLQWMASRSDAAPSADITAEEAAADEELPPVDRVPAEDVYDAPFEQSIDPTATYRATLATTEGDIVLELDAAGAPLATNNLVNLARDGYYDEVIFHRVIDTFVIQTGDPAGTGCGQFDCARFDPQEPSYPGYTFEDELESATDLVAEAGGYPRGTVAMANAGPDTNGSQFFIVQGDLVELPPAYTVFGQVIDGMDVVDAIAATDTEASDRPVSDIEIRSVTITED